MSINNLDPSKKTIVLKQIERTLENLNKNNMNASYVADAQEACKKVSSILNIGDSVSTGGSTTLRECGIMDLISSDKYTYYNHNVQTDPVLREDMLRKAYFADFYLTSSNAVTMDGCLYNVDGNSNRVSAILYGPKKVIVVVGYNKIVRNLDEAITRVKTIAAPANSTRLNCNTFCAQTGSCTSLKEADSSMCSGCKGDNRICCNYVVSAQQRHKDRIHVIIVGESLGY